MHCLNQYRTQKREFLFPVIIKTLDFYRFNTSSVSKSPSSFKYFEIQDLNATYAKKMFVNDYRLWTEAEFDEIYEMVGRHVGLYYQLYADQGILKILLKQAVERSRVQ